MTLTPKQEMFVKEYLIDLNATQAAIRAGYSERSAEVEGFRLLRNAKVASAVQEAMDKRKEIVSVTAQDVLESILRIRKKAEDADRHGDALKANELLGKHLKLFTDKTEMEITGKDGGPIEYTDTERAARLASILERARKARDRQAPE